MGVILSNRSVNLSLTWSALITQPWHVISVSGMYVKVAGVQWLIIWSTLGQLGQLKDMCAAKEWAVVLWCYAVAECAHTTEVCLHNRVVGCFSQLHLGC